jgi:hypothetical protein
MSDIKFIRKGGRIIPIKEKKKKSPDYKGASMGAAGAAFSIAGAPKLSKLFKTKFGKRTALLSAVFAGEAIAAEGIDRFAESLHLSKRKEQNLKNVAGGTLGVLGALSALKGLK